MNIDLCKNFVPPCEYYASSATVARQVREHYLPHADISASTFPMMQ